VILVIEGWANNNPIMADTWIVVPASSRHLVAHVLRHGHKVITGNSTRTTGVNATAIKVSRHAKDV
jgi:hypothetical protein